MSNNELIHQSASIFNTIEKWNALFEIFRRCDDIMDHWLETGAKALRQDFEENASPGWECARWGVERDSRWYLTEFGPASVGFGFGWKGFEFHLHLGDESKFDRGMIVGFLGTPEFKPLITLFGPQTIPPFRASDGSLASDRTINPYGSNSEMRLQTIAWRAAHETSDFVRKMAAVIRQITDNREMTELLRKLNRLASR